MRAARRRRRTLQAVVHDGRPWLVLKRACEQLGLQPHGQLEKLRAASWAVTQIICATGPDGKTREMACLAAEHVPMWLAGLNANKLSPELRPKIEHRLNRG